VYGDRQGHTGSDIAALRAGEERFLKSRKQLRQTSHSHGTVTTSPRDSTLEVGIWYTDLVEIPIAHDGRTKALDRSARSGIELLGCRPL
jgi:hypothetical protein